MAGPNVTKMDASWEHLYPPFAKLLREVLDEVEAATGEPWELVEGYRSGLRQLWLYASGRTRKGPIVTKLKTPRHHGVGLAADVRPVRVSKSGYDAIPNSHWHVLRMIYRRKAAGGRFLENPAWSFGDMQHVQWPRLDVQTHLAAGVWVRAGFPVPKAETVKPRPKSAPPVKVYFEEELIEDATAFFHEPGVVAVALRPMVDTLDWNITSVKDGVARVVFSGSQDPEKAHERRHREALLPLILRKEGGGERGYVLARDLGKLTPIEPNWNGPARTLKFRRDPELSDDIET